VTINRVKIRSTSAASVVNAMSLINELLDFSRPAAGRLALEQRPFRLQELLRRAGRRVDPAKDDRAAVQRVQERGPATAC
jgi:signal transduction histidine kinase